MEGILIRLELGRVFFSPKEGELYKTFTKGREQSAGLV